MADWTDVILNFECRLVMQALAMRSMDYRLFVSRYCQNSTGDQSVLQKQRSLIMAAIWSLHISGAINPPRNCAIAETSHGIRKQFSCVAMKLSFVSLVKRPARASSER